MWCVCVWVCWGWARVVAGAGDEASPRPNFDRSPAKKKNSETVSDNEALGSQCLGSLSRCRTQCINQNLKKKKNQHLTRIRIARQTAFPASQCSGWSGKWDTVIVLQKPKMTTQLHILQTNQFLLHSCDILQLIKQEQALTSGILVCSICKSS